MLSYYNILKLLQEQKYYIVHVFVRLVASSSQLLSLSSIRRNC